MSGDAAHPGKASLAGTDPPAIPIEGKAADSKSKFVKAGCATAAWTPSITRSMHEQIDEFNSL
jgi:hypothetical protein